MRRELIDGQEMVLLENEDWDRIREDPKLDGVRITDPEVFDRYMKFIGAHQEFAVGLKLFTRWWMPMFLLRINDRWQRVHVERLTCNQCGWVGESANPYISDLYIGLPDRWDVMKQADKLPKKQCPSCAANLPRPSIWVEGESAGG